MKLMDQIHQLSELTLLLLIVHSLAAVIFYGAIHLNKEDISLIQTTWLVLLLYKMILLPGIIIRLQSLPLF